jgi:hypothetical protein
MLGKELPRILLTFQLPGLNWELHNAGMVEGHVGGSSAEGGEEGGGAGNEELSRKPSCTDWGIILAGFRIHP